MRREVGGTGGWDLSPNIRVLDASVCFDLLDLFKVSSVRVTTVHVPTMCVWHFRVNMNLRGRLLSETYNIKTKEGTA